MKRGYWLCGLLLIVLLTAVSQRQWLARLPNSRARQCLLRHHEDTAFKWLQFSQRLSPGNADTEFLLARVSRRQGLMSDVRRHLLRAAELGYPIVELDREQVLALAQSGQLRKAEPYLAGLLSDPGEDGAEICEAYVIGYLGAQRFDLAQVLTETWMREFPLDPQPYYWRASMFREMEDRQAAERELRRALELQPQHFAAAYALGEVLLEGARFEEALSFFRLALGKVHIRNDALLGCARCLQELGRFEEARSNANEALASNPANVAALIRVAKLEIEEGNYRAAADRLKPAVEREPRNRDLRFNYGIALSGAGQKSEALPHLQYATEAVGHLERAKQLSLEARRKPDDISLRFEIGRIYLEYGFPKDGVIWLKSVLEYVPDHKPTHQALADYYASKVGDDAANAELASHHQRLAAGAAPKKP